MEIDTQSIWFLLGVIYSTFGLVLLVLLDETMRFHRSVQESVSGFFVCWCLWPIAAAAWVIAWIARCLKN